jgi:hypothetical protein
VAFRVGAVPRVVFAFSTIFVSIPTGPPGAGGDGLRGEVGRASKDFPGDVVGRTGDLGWLREFADLGERTCEGWSLAREVVRAGGCGGPLGRFLGFSISSFSLSVVISSLVLLAGSWEPSTESIPQAFCKSLWRWTGACLLLLYQVLRWGLSFRRRCPCYRTRL